MSYHFIAFFISQIKDFLSEIVVEVGDIHIIIIEYESNILTILISFIDFTAN